MSRTAASRSARRSRGRARRRDSDVEMNHGVRRNAEAIKRGFDEYRVAFSRITRRAKSRFEQGNWHGMMADSRARLRLYNRVVRRVIAEVRSHAHVRERDILAWIEVKRAYAELIAGTGASEIAETFFNSVTRRIFGIVGVNPQIEFVDFEFRRIPTGLGDTPYRTYASIDGTEAQVTEIFVDFAFDAPYRDMISDARLIAGRIDDAWRAGEAPLPFEAIEVLKPVFYRRKGAYLVGRARGGTRVMPMVIALRNGPRGVYADAVLVREEDLNVVFSYTRSYFQVDVDRPSDTIEFLQSLMPSKPVAELSNSLGFDRHGKTELYRQLRRHLAYTTERFEPAPGTPGKVMAVFAMPGFDVVFKVVRDKFPAPRQTTHEEIRRRYRLVAGHDRAGRLVDAQEFDRVVFKRRYFLPELLDELVSTASRNVSIVGDEVVVERMYAERRVEPLDMSLRHADDQTRDNLLADYVQAILDLAATGIFPGDLLFKNFGVTRHGRVVFYGYDELCLLGDCHFKELSVDRDGDGEAPVAGKGGEVFPQSFDRFVSLPVHERDAFISNHAELFQPVFWQLLQDRYASGEVADVYPYRSDQRIWST